MRSHLLYIAIGVLLAGNIALLTRKSPPPAVQAPRVEPPGLFQERIIQLDSLVLRRWSDNSVVRPDFLKPTMLFFFSKKSCMSCVEKGVDFLTSRAVPTLETYIISTDLYTTGERTPYDARFLRSLPFFALESVGYSRDFDVGLPALMVVNGSGEILFMKQVLPSDDLHGEYLFWRRINFLYSLLAL